MDPPSDQSALDWARELHFTRIKRKATDQNNPDGSTSAVREEGRPPESVQQSYMGHLPVLPDNSSAHEASQSPVYMPSQIAPSRDHPQNTLLAPNHFYPQYATSQARTTHVMQDQSTYYPQQAQATSYFPPASQPPPAQPQPPAQHPYYEGINNHMNGHYPYPYRNYSTVRSGETSGSSTQIVMRKRRAPYPTPTTSKDADKGVKSRLDQQRRGHGVARPSVQTQALPKREPSYHDEMSAQPHSSMSATQAVPIDDPSPIDHRLSSASGLATPVASERIQYTHPTGWNDEVLASMKHEQAAGGAEEFSGASQSSPIPSLAGSNRNATVFIHSGVPRASMAATNTAEDYDQYKNFFPADTEQHRLLRIAMHDVMSSEWKLRNELEPTSGDLLQFSMKIVSRDGSTSFRCLMWHQGKECGKTWNRAERILAHLRGMIELRPFACEGNEADDACNCGQRFYAEDTLTQHKKNLQTIECEYCSSCITPRNKKRHLRHNCAKSPERAQ